MISNRAAAGLAAAMLILTAPAQPAAEIPRRTPDGLELLEQKRSGEGMAIVYVRPGATLAAYKRVMLDPVKVTFDKSWTARNPRVSATDRERVARELAEEFRIVFTDVLESDGGYEIVQASGPDVLRVSAGIFDLYIEMPGVGKPDHSSTYVVSAGRMSLVAELQDAESGTVLARVLDRQTASSSGRFPGVLHWTTRTKNRAEARRVLRAWADLLRAALDSARDAAR